MRFAHAVEIASVRGEGQDRVAVVERDERVVIALADGAGGTANGAVAAEAVIDAVTKGWDADASALLADLDGDGARLGHGQTTAVVLRIDAVGIVGASVGDSGAWLVTDAEIVDLTDGQIRKPLLGSGCEPVAFRAGPLGTGTLLVASDGLLRYGKRQDIARIVRGADLAAAAKALVDLVRLPTGGLQDDVSIVLCRETLRS
jgi:serine/threonine protein phosphatase PrpC